MTEFLMLSGPILLRTTCFLAVTAIVAWIALRIFRVKSSRLHRIIWLAVLLQGWLIWTIPIPVANEITQPAVLFDTKIAPPTAGVEPDLFVEHELLRTGIAPEADLPQSQFSTEFVENESQEGSASSNTVAPMMGILLSIWLMGMFVLVVRFAWRYWRFAHWMAQARPAKAEWDDEWRSILCDAGIDAKIPLCIHDAGPMLCRMPGGYRVVVSAAFWRSLSRFQRRAVLQHELAHYQRGDVWKALFVRLMAVPHWFNPLAWLAVRRFEECAEWACDDVVRHQSPNSVAQYAHALLDLTDRSRYVSGYSPAAGGWSLSTRIRRLVTPMITEDSTMKRISMLTVVTGLSLLGLIRIVSAEPAPQENGDVKSAPATELSTKPEPAVAPRLRNRNTKKPTEAVIDMGHLFKNLSEFRTETALLKKDVKQADMKMRSMQKELAKLHRENKGKDSKFEELALKLQLERKAMQQRFVKREAVIYDCIYRKIQKEVARYAKANGIRIVHRAKSKEDTTSKAKSAREILQRVNQPIVYMARDEVDITDEILSRLQKAYRIERTAAKPNDTDSKRN